MLKGGEVGGKEEEDEARKRMIHDPAVFLQFMQRQVCPRRRVKSSESLTLTVMAPQLQVASILTCEKFM